MTLRCSDTFLRVAYRLRLGLGHGLGAPIYRSQPAGRVRSQAQCIQALRCASDSSKDVLKRLPPRLDSAGPPNPETKTKSVSAIARSEATVSALEEELLYHITRSQGTTTLKAILHELIDARKVKPTQLHYTAYFLCQQGSEHGSSEQIGDLLDDMDSDSVQMTESLASAALQASVIHPDLSILLDVLQRCEERWIKPTQTMQHFVAAIYARLGQFELAMHWLEKLESTPSQEPSVHDRNEAELWLYVVFLAEIIQHTFSEELFMTICYRLHDSHSVPMREMDIPFALWNLAFSWAVQNENLHAVKWIWRTFIVRQYVQPDVPVLSQVEQLAHRHGDQELEHSCKAMIEVLVMDACPARDAETVIIDEDHRLAASQNDPNMRYARIPSDQRLDPWAMLTEDMDPGAAQPRIEQSQSQQAAKIAADRASYEASTADASRTTFGGLVFQDVDLKALYAPFEGFKKSSRDPVDFANELVTILKHRDRNSADKRLTRDLLKVLFKPNSSGGSEAARTSAKITAFNGATNKDSVTRRGSRNKAENSPTRSGLSLHPAERIARGSSRDSAEGDISSKTKA